MATAEPTVRDVMDLNPVVVPPSATVQHVLSIMNQRRIGSVLIVAEDRRLAGIFTERDLLKRVASAVPGWRDYAVSEWMTKTPHVIEPDVGWEEAVARMHKLRVRHLPVVDNDFIIGIVSTRLLMSRREEYLNVRIARRTTELKDANEQLIARDAEQRHNLRTAGLLQTRMLLPQAPPDWPELRWAIHYAPLDHLGGDHYDFAQPEEGRLGFLIADASGHSIAAAMVAMLTRFAFEEASRKTSPGEALGVMNQRLQELTEERFVTAFYGIFDRRSQTLRYAAAGHPHPLRYEAACGRVTELKASGFLLGIIPNEVYAEKEVKLEPGDKLCFFTDGVVEARNEIGELYGIARLTACLTQYGDQPAVNIVDHVMQNLRDFCGTAPYMDDVTLIVGEMLVL